MGIVQREKFKRVRVTSGHRLQSNVRSWRDLIPPANQADSMESRFLFFSPVIRRLLFVLFLSFCSFIHGSLSHSISSSYLSLSVFFKNVVVVEYAISCRECGLSILFPVNMRGIWSISKRRLFKLVVACGWQTVDDWRTTQLWRSHNEKNWRWYLVPRPLQRLLSGRLRCLRMNVMKLDIHHRGLAWGRSRVTQRCEALFCVRNSTIFSW